MERPQPDRQARGAGRGTGAFLSQPCLRPSPTPGHCHTATEPRSQKLGLWSQEHAPGFVRGPEGGHQGGAHPGREC
uniref:Heme oxygenase 1 n=1 Tax=Homo sapiens TaxID=9606 RepID=A0A7I2YQL9_HUMAN